MRLTHLLPVLLATGTAYGQMPPPLPPGMHMPTPTPNDTLESPSIRSDGRITFRIYAPNAKAVAVHGEMLEFGQTLELARESNGVWSATMAQPVAGGTYRYTFDVDGVSVVDPRNTRTSQDQVRVQSLLHVDDPSAAFEAAADVPHGAIAEVHYRSNAFSQDRRMHIYTPPGYEKSAAALPVLYLLHGGGDSDDSWPSIGRAGYILDNLIAAKLAKPMILVMPAGHVPKANGTVASAGNAMSGNPANDPFTGDLLNSIIPYVESNYHVLRGPTTRAIAGLSMGGIQAANIGLTHPELFSEIGIFSSGWFPDQRKVFFAENAEALRRAAGKRKLLWIAYGKTDIAHENAVAMLAKFDEVGVKYEAHESAGGHVWYNWRHYLNEFAPKLFR